MITTRDHRTPLSWQASRVCVNDTPHREQRVQALRDAHGAVKIGRYPTRRADALT